MGTKARPTSSMMGLFLLGCELVGCSGEPLIESTAPGDGESPVSIWTDLDVAFSKPVDSTSIGDSTITLQRADGVLLPCEASYDEESGIATFDPVEPLDYDTEYSWTLSGITRTNGEELEPSNQSFRTYVNPKSEALSFHYATGDITAWWALTYDDRGRLVSTVSYNGPGADAVWQTDDDVIVGVVTEKWTDQGERDVFHYTAPGDDGAWFTADDVIGRHDHALLNASGDVLAEIFFVDPGDDGEWLTGDDAPNNVRRYERDDLGRLVRDLQISDWGDDGVWLTDDDLIHTNVAYSYDARGLLERVAAYLNAGDDGSWFTTDDEPAYYWAYSYDELGHRIRYVLYDRAGVDGVWLTADDRVDNYQGSLYDAEGRVVERVVVTGPGADDEWFTDDDDLNDRVVYDWSQPGLGRRLIYHSPGADREWRTADDVIYAYMVDELEEHRSVTRSSTYSSPGADGEWFTADDPVSLMTFDEYDGIGNRVTREGSADAGADGSWLTDDDLRYEQGWYVTSW